MKEYQSLSHTRWDCKYHVVFIPKRRKKRIFGVLRRHMCEMFHDLVAHKESKIVEGHLIKKMVRAYIRNQEDEDERYDQMKLEME